MARIVAPDGCIGIDVRTETGKTTYDGRIFETDNPRHIRLLKDQGAFVGSIGGIPRTSGYRCPACAHGSYFKLCGRCGATCSKEI